MLYLIISGCSSIYNPATGKEESVFTPTENNEEKSGQKVSKQVEEKFKSVNNWNMQTRLQAIGQKIAAVCDRKDITYHFEILDDKEINAFALPGGYVYVFKGLMDKIKSDDEIAAVVAHEVGHIAARHVAKRIRGSLGIDALLILLATVKSDAESKQQALQGLTELMLHYSREDELQADRLAIKYMKLAGYNPQAMVTFLEKLRKIEYDKPIEMAHLYKTHPYLADRIKNARQEINGMIEFKDYINAVEQ